VKRTCLSSSRHRAGIWPVLKGLTVCLVLALALIMPACKKKETAGTTTVRFVTWKPNQPAVWDEIIRTFEAGHPGIRVVRETGPHSSTGFHDLLTQKLKNKSPDVDVFFMDVIWPSEFAAAGWAMPLDSYFPQGERDKFLDGTVLANTYKGHIYGVPVFVDGGMLYYRKDLLEKYGFKPPRTWGEMVSQAKKITSGEAADNVAMEGFSGQFKQYEGLVCDMMEYILSNGGNIVDPDTGQPGIAAKPAVDAVRFVRDQIIGNIAPEGELTYEEPESLALFTQGKAVFLRNWPYAWEVSNDPSRSRVAGKVGIAKLPHFPGGRSYSTLGGWQLAISSYSKHKDAAWTFIKFLTSSRIQKLLAVKAGLAPTRKALYDDGDILKADPQFRSMKDVFLTAYPRPRSPLYPAISNILQRYFSSAISDRNSDIEGEARKASQEMEKIIALTRE
jgi:trehalose/maltose transport system substrate-binding protein